jgi:predicted acetyltransferase
MAEIKVVPATEQDRAVIAGLMQFYIYDFSEMEPPGSTGFDVGADGLFGPYPHLDSYWTDENRWPLLFKLGEANVGFALVNQVSHRDDGFVERNMAEFFLMRQQRHGSAAASAAAQVFAMLPGHWEVAVVARNKRALSFWPRAIAAAGVRQLEKLEGDGVHWTGPIWTFVA